MLLFNLCYEWLDAIEKFMVFIIFWWYDNKLQ